MKQLTKEVKESYLVENEDRKITKNLKGNNKIKYLNGLIITGAEEIKEMIISPMKNPVIKVPSVNDRINSWSGTTADVRNESLQSILIGSYCSPFQPTLSESYRFKGILRNTPS